MASSQWRSPKLIERLRRFVWMPIGRLALPGPTLRSTRTMRIPFSYRVLPRSRGMAICVETPLGRGSASLRKFAIRNSKFEIGSSASSSAPLRLCVETPLGRGSASLGKFEIRNSKFEIDSSAPLRLCVKIPFGRRSAAQRKSKISPPASGLWLRISSFEFRVFHKCVLARACVLSRETEAPTVPVSHIWRRPKI